MINLIIHDCKLLYSISPIVFITLVPVMISWFMYVLYYIGKSISYEYEKYKVLKRLRRTGR